MNRSSAPARSLTVAAVAAAATILVSGLFPSGSADARRRRPEDPCARAERQSARKIARLESELAAYQGAYQELESGLARVERFATRNIGNQRNRDRMVKLSSQSRTRAAAYFAPAAPVAPAPVVVAPPPPVDPYVDPHTPYVDPNNAPQAMTPRQFKRLRKSVESASFANDRIDLVRSAAAHNLFTVDQVIDLVKVCDFEKSKISIAVILYPQVVDLNEWYRVYRALDFKSSRDKLRNRIGERRQPR